MGFNEISVHLVIIHKKFCYYFVQLLEHASSMCIALLIHPINI